MQMAITFMAVVAGMVFSLAVALLAEELIFGQVFRLFFVSKGQIPTLAAENAARMGQPTVAMKSGQKR